MYASCKASGQQPHKKKNNTMLRLNCFFQAKEGRLDSERKRRTHKFRQI